MSEFIRTNDQSVKKSIHSLEMKFSDVALDTNNREVYFGFLLANKDLISDVVNDKHPIWKLSNNAAKKWLLELTRQPFGLPSVVALNAFNKMSVSLLDEVGELPIIRRDVTSIRVQYVKDLLGKAGIKQQNDEPIGEMTLVELFSNLEHVTRKGCATYSSGWDGKYDSEGELVIE